MGDKIINTSSKSAEVQVKCSLHFYYSPELSADVLGLERSADSHPALQRDEHREVDRAALTEHPNLKNKAIITLRRASPINFLKGEKLLPTTSVYILHLL